MFIAYECWPWTGDSTRLVVRPRRVTEAEMTNPLMAFHHENLDPHVAAKELRAIADFIEHEKVSPDIVRQLEQGALRHSQNETE